MEVADYWRGKYEAKAWIEAADPDDDMGWAFGEVKFALQKARNAMTTSEKMFWRGYASEFGKIVNEQLMAV